MSDENGFLTDIDKEFLRGEKEYASKQGRYDRRRAIRERTREAFRDFQLLRDTLDREERDKIFDPPVDERVDLLTAMGETIAFLYHALEGDAGSNRTPIDRSIDFPFSQILELGVRHGEIARQNADAERPFGGRVEVTFEVNIDHNHTADRSRVIEELARNGGMGLTDQELRAVITHAARDTVRGPDHMIDGEPIDEALDDYRSPDLYGLAEAVEEKAAEIEDDEDGEE
ncbi:hypothetical protein DJ68_14615 [Halorubrum sp. C3]|nr:hypothetical protein DJ68_14615 [Halorubrum sp. C3]